VTGPIVILGIFVADTTYRADRLPRIGETILGHRFTLGPGGKGSNQSVATARAGGEVHFIARIGRDTFADLAYATWADAGVQPAVIQVDREATGAACIFVEEETGDNAIIVCPGAAGGITPSDIDTKADLIRRAGVFVTQLEQPVDAAMRALEIARDGGAVTILNPAPAATLPDAIFPLCDYVTPNESEAELLTGVPVCDMPSARRAAEALLEKGVGAALLTLGGNGALLVTRDGEVHVPAFLAERVVETTGAGDAFNGGFAVALAEGLTGAEAVRFGCAVAGLSVTRAGAAASMPSRDEIDALLARS